MIQQPGQFLSSRNTTTPFAASHTTIICILRQLLYKSQPLHGNCSINCVTPPLSFGLIDQEVSPCPLSLSGQNRYELRRGDQRTTTVYPKETAKGGTLADSPFVMLEQHRFSKSGLTLGELEACACSFLAVFLSFLDTRIAGDEPGFLQRAAEVCIDVDERLGDAVLDRSGLT